MIVRQPDPEDGRRMYVSLREEARTAVLGWLEAVGN